MDLYGSGGGDAMGREGAGSPLLLHTAPRTVDPRDIVPPRFLLDDPVVYAHDRMAGLMDLEHMFDDDESSGPSRDGGEWTLLGDTEAAVGGARASSVDFSLPVGVSDPLSLDSGVIGHEEGSGEVGVAEERRVALKRPAPESEHAPSASRARSETSTDAGAAGRASESQRESAVAAAEKAAEEAVAKLERAEKAGEEAEDEDFEPGTSRGSSRRRRGASRSGMSEAEKARERNRVHARRSRLRKKYFVQSLQTSVTTLEEENGRLKGYIAKLTGKPIRALQAEIDATPRGLGSLSKEVSELRCIVKSEDVGGAVLEVKEMRGSAVFVAGAKLWRVDLRSGGGLEEVCSVPEGATSVAVADYLAAEEFDRYSGFWVSKEGGWVCWQVTDESVLSDVPIPIVPVRDSEPLRQDRQSHRFVYAGGTNPRVALCVRGEDDGTVHWLKLGKEDEGEVDWVRGWYLGRVWWIGDVLVVALVNREQSKLRILRFDAPTFQPHLILEEEDPSWINIVDNLILSSSPSTSASPATLDLIYTSEMSGYRQLYRLTSSTTPLSTPSPTPSGHITLGVGTEWKGEVTTGKFVIHRALGVWGGKVYFLANADSPLRCQLCFKPLKDDDEPSEEGVGGGGEGGGGEWGGGGADGGGEESEGHHHPIPGCELVDDSGIWKIGEDVRGWGVGKGIRMVHGEQVGTWVEQVAVDEEGALLETSRLTEAPSSALLSIDHGTGKATTTLPLHTPPLPKSPPPKTILTSITSPDSPSTTLFLALNLPSSPSSSAPMPIHVRLYGGPHVQLVRESWMTGGDPRVKQSVGEGVVVVRGDNRGSWNRGKAFEAAVKHDLGNKEVLDQVAFVKALTSSPLNVDASRVVVSGWSYGGYLSTMCLAKRPDIFRAAISGAPVTHWGLYDSAYTERYMGTPESNPSGYKSSDILTHLSPTLKHLYDPAKDSREGGGGGGGGDGGEEGEETESSTSFSSAPSDATSPTSSPPLKVPRLMLLHGLRDENVLFAHTGRLIAQLQTLAIPHELVLLPGERHGPRDPGAAAFAGARMAAFAKAHLFPSDE